MKHKWHKEICAWADGGQIEAKEVGCTQWKLDDNPYWDDDDWEYRIKPQPKEDWVMICKKCGDELGIVYEPKEPQYLYVYANQHAEPRFCWNKITPLKTDLIYQGKIKLEQDDE